MTRSSETRHRTGWCGRNPPDLYSRDTCFKPSTIYRLSRQMSLTHVPWYYTFK